MLGDANRSSEKQINRMGCYIGQVRAYEGVSLEQLAQGLCTKSYLCRVENGEREAGKLLTDALLQRLGKPVERFDRILDWNEYQQWLRRQSIWRHLSAGEVSLAAAAIQAYQATDVLEHQFLQTARLNLRALQGAAAEELRGLALAALLLTQPSLIDHGEPQLLSQNEGWLLLTYLELRERLDGLEAVSGDYQELLQLLCQRRYDARERVYLFPYVACHVIEAEFRQGRLAEALAICERALRELSQEKRLYAYERLLEWKQRLFTAMGRTEQEPQQLLHWLNVLQAQGPAQVKLLVPYMERGNVYCLNQVIRERRKLLGLSLRRMPPMVFATSAPCPGSKIVGAPCTRRCARVCCAGLTCLESDMTTKSCPSTMMTISCEAKSAGADWSAMQPRRRSYQNKCGNISKVQVLTVNILQWRKLQFKSTLPAIRRNGHLKMKRPSC